MADLSASDSPSEPLVRVRELHKAFGDLKVLCGIDLNVAAGEHVGIIGASGSGKSTLLRVLMTLERPDAGDVEIEGESMWRMRRNGREIAANEAHLRRLRGKLGMVFQHFNLFPHMTVLENITAAPRLVWGTSPDEALRRAEELLTLVGLEDKARAYPAQLSGGQKQRVAIARALAPRVSCSLTRSPPRWTRNSSAMSSTSCAVWPVIAK